MRLKIGKKPMIGEIIKILPFKKSRNEDETYLRVEFKMEDGKWAKTDLVPSFRNYWRWKRVLRVGNVVRNLKMRDKITVDADSFPQLVVGSLVGSGSKFTLEELNKMGVFG